MTTRAVVRGRRPLPARAGGSKRRVRSDARHHRRMDPLPLGHRAAAFRRRGRDDLRSRPARRAGGPGRCRARRGRHRRDHRRDLDRRPDLSLRRDDGAGDARHDARASPSTCRRSAPGFVYALANANALIVSGQAKRVLVIGAETFSRIMDWTDRGTCVLFGDGAGALVLEARGGRRHAPPTAASCRPTSIPTGGYRDMLYVDGGVSTQTTGHLRMQGKEVFRHAVEKLAQTAHAALDKAGLDRRRRRLDRAAPGQHPHHQGNRREKLGVPWTASSSRCRTTATPRPRRSRWRCRSDVERGQIRQGDLRGDRGDRRRTGLGLGRPALVDLLQRLHAQPVDIDLLFARLSCPKSLEDNRMADKTLTRMDLSEAVFREVGLSRNESAATGRKRARPHVRRPGARRTGQDLVLRHLQRARQGRPGRAQSRRPAKRCRSIRAAF